MRRKFLKASPQIAVENPQSVIVRVVVQESRFTLDLGRFSYSAGAGLRFPLQGQMYAHSILTSVQRPRWEYSYEDEV